MELFCKWGFQNEYGTKPEKKDQYVAQSVNHSDVPHCWNFLKCDHL